MLAKLEQMQELVDDVTSHLGVLAADAKKRGDEGASAAAESLRAQITAVAEEMQKAAASEDLDIGRLEKLSKRLAILQKQLTAESSAERTRIADDITLLKHWLSSEQFKNWIGRLFEVQVKDPSNPKRKPAARSLMPEGATMHLYLTIKKLDIGVGTMIEAVRVGGKGFTISSTGSPDSTASRRKRPSYTAMISIPKGYKNEREYVYYRVLFILQKFIETRPNAELPSNASLVLQAASWRSVGKGDGVGSLDALFRKLAEDANLPHLLQLKRQKDAKERLMELHIKGDPFSKEVLVNAEDAEGNEKLMIWDEFWAEEQMRLAEEWRKQKDAEDPL